MVHSDTVKNVVRFATDVATRTPMIIVDAKVCTAYGIKRKYHKAITDYADDMIADAYDASSWCIDGGKSIYNMDT